MSGQNFEAFLARIYGDQIARNRFLADPLVEATKAGLSAEEIAAVVRIDVTGLQLLAESLEKKRRERFSAKSG